MTTLVLLRGAVTSSTSSSMKRLAVSSSTWVNSSSNWSITSSSWSCAVGEHPLDGAAHATRREHDVEQRGRGSIATRTERCLELLERVRRRRHLDPEPVRRHRQRARRQRRQQPGPHDARLAAAARPDDGDEPSADAGLAEAGDRAARRGAPARRSPRRRRRRTPAAPCTGSRSQRRRAVAVGATPSASVRAWPNDRRVSSTADAGSVCVARSSTVRTVAGSAPRTCLVVAGQPGERRRRDDRQAVDVRRRRHRTSAELLGRGVRRGRATQSASCVRC